MRRYQRFIWRINVVALATTLSLAALDASAQSTVATGFIPGARTILTLDFAGTPVGEFPKGLRLLQGNLEVVDKDGMHMLRASSPSEFVVQLPEALPTNFTLEFDLIPKACCNPVDLTVEGVISGSRSSVSAQLEWDASHFAVVGGNSQMFQMDMPAAVAATLPSTLTRVAISFEDETIRMYTNGRRLYTLGERKFVRGRVLRISLGGQDDDKYAVYLASLRVADLAPSIVASNAPQAGPRSVSAMPAPNVAPPPGANAGTVPASFSVTVTPGSNGPVVSWPPVATASGYTVQRYKIDDTQCCSSSSGRGWLTGLSWQDTPLPVSGRYVYLVLAATPAGQVRGTATFDFTLAPTSPAIASRAIPLSGFTAMGTVATIQSRTITLAGFSASASATGVVSRTIALTGFTANGATVSGAVASRTIALTGFTSAGSAAVVASRTIQLAGWTAVGTP